MNRVERLKEMIAKFPNDCFSRHALAMEYLKMGNVSDAIQEMEAILEIDEKHVGTYYHLAKAYEKIEKYTNALEVLDKGIKVAISTSAQNDLRELNGALDQLKNDLDLD
ncbi:MAG: tetratricopeptide repeat protein [Bacteroidota bacterium]|jgi:predicted Zn-dependent protease